MRRSQADDQAKELARARRRLRMRREARRRQMRAAHRPLLGRDFVFAVALLVMGIVFPLVSALADPRVAALSGGRPLAELPTAMVEPAPTSGAIVPWLGPPALSTATPQPALSIATLPPASPTDTPAPLDLDGGAAQAPAPPPGPPHIGPAPILMYHYIRGVDGGADPLGYELSVTPELFEQHMAWLAQHGYTGVRVDTLMRCMAGEPICPPRPVALTFDDGYADAYTSALPVLRRYGFQATFYIVSGFVGQPGYMGWPELAALRDAGMEIGSHTIDHTDLTLLDAGELQRQALQSKLTLEDNLGISVVSFCYPTGRYNAAVEEHVRQAGYTSAVTTRWDDDYGNLLALPRRRIAGGTTADEFGWIVTGG